MFSSITTASSTTKPVAIVRAMSVKLLMLNPARYIIPNVPMSEIGIERAGMMVAGILRKNRKITKMTRAIDNISSNFTP